MKNKKICLLALCCLGYVSLSTVAAEKDAKPDLSECFTFTMHDVEYNMPIPVSELLENGWECPYTYTSDELPEMSYTNYALSDDHSKEISLKVINPTDEIIKTVDGYVCEITFEGTSAGLFTCENGLKYGMTKDDVQKAFGRSDKVKGSIWTYEVEAVSEDAIEQLKGFHEKVGTQSVIIDFGDTDRIQSITLKYYDIAD